MRGKSLILIVIALGCGLVASIGISQILDRGSGEAKKEDTKKIYVAVRDVDIHEVFNAEMIKLEEWPAQKVPEGAVSKLEEVKGLIPNQRLYAGEVIRKEKLVDPNKAGGHSIRIPKGYRVQAVKVSSDGAVGNLISPGDHVDVQVYLRKGGNIPQSVTKTVLEDVRVFAVNAETAKQTDENGNKITAKTVSLLVKPPQLQTLLLASRVGQVSLSLRHPDDETQTDSGDGAGLAELLNGRTEDATPSKDDPTLPAANPEAVAAAKSAASDFKNFLDGLNETIKTPAPNAPADQVASVEKVHVMEILTPEGITTVELQDTTDFSQARPVNEPLGAPGANVPDVAPDTGDAWVDPDGPAASDADGADGDDSTGDSDDSDWNPDV